MGVRNARIHSSMMPAVARAVQLTCSLCSVIIGVPYFHFRQISLELFKGVPFGSPLNGIRCYSWARTGRNPLTRTAFSFQQGGFVFSSCGDCHYGWLLYHVNRPGLSSNGSLCAAEG